MLDYFRMVSLFGELGNAMDITSNDKPSYNIQSHETISKKAENKYFAEHRRTSSIQPKSILHRRIFPSPKVSRFVQWSFNSYDVSSNNGQYLTPECFAAITHG
jgi:hypothetical protein